MALEILGRQERMDLHAAMRELVESVVHGPFATQRRAGVPEVATVRRALAFSRCTAWYRGSALRNTC